MKLSDRRNTVQFLISVCADTHTLTTKLFPVRRFSLRDKTQVGLKQTGSKRAQDFNKTYSMKGNEYRRYLINNTTERQEHKNIKIRQYTECNRRDTRKR